MMLDTRIARYTKLRGICTGYLLVDNSSFPAKTKHCFHIRPAKTENTEAVSSFLKYNLQKASATHSDLFTDQVVFKWGCWANEEFDMWGNWERYCQHSVFSLPSAYLRMKLHCHLFLIRTPNVPSSNRNNSI